MVGDTQPPIARDLIPPTLWEMAEVVWEEAIPPLDGDAWVVFKRTVRFPTLEAVHERYDPYFEKLRRNGDELAGARQASFYKEVTYHLAQIAPDRLITIQGPYFPIGQGSIASPAKPA